MWKIVKIVAVFVLRNRIEAPATHGPACKAHTAKQIPTRGLAEQPGDNTMRTAYRKKKHMRHALQNLNLYETDYQDLTLPIARTMPHDAGKGHEIPETHCP